MAEHNSLSQAEWRVMEALWDRAPQTIKQLTDVLSPETGWSKHTVISFLNRMESKGAVSYVTQGRARAYRPAYPREEATLTESNRFLSRVFRGSLGLMVSSMVEGKALKEQEIDDLLEILQRAKEEAGND